MAMVTVNIDGEGELIAALKQLGHEAYPVAKEAIMAGAEIVREEASRMAPKRTGSLSQSIMVDEPEGEMIGGEVAALVGLSSAVFYGRFIELGTSKMSARPFLVPALKAAKRRVEAVVVQALRSGLGL